MTIVIRSVPGWDELHETHYPVIPPTVEGTVDAGVLWIPNEFRDEYRPNEDADREFEEALLEAMTTPIKE